MTEKKLNLRDPNEIYYQPLGETPYSDESFLEGYSKLGGLEQALKLLHEDPQNTQAIQIAGKTLFNNPNWYFQTKTSPRPALEEASAEGRKGIEKYFSKNEQAILKKFDSNDYKTLITAVPLAKIKEEGEHKTIIDAVNEFKTVQENSQEISKMAEYVSGKIKKATKYIYIQKEFARYSSNEAFVKQMFANYASYAENNVKEVLETGDCEGAFKASLKESKKKGQYYQIMANMLHQKFIPKE